MSASNSPMEAAFQRAGYVPAQDRLMQRAIEAWAKFPGANQLAQRRSHIAVMLAGEMTWQLMNTHNPAGVTFALEGLLRSAAASICAQAPKVAAGGDVGRDGGGGQMASDTQGLFAPSANPMPSGRVSGGRSGMGQFAGDAQGGAAHPAPSLTRMADRQQSAMSRKIETMVRLSKLDLFKINGRPVGDLTPDEARGWLQSHDRDGRYVRMLITNLPPNRPIREFIKPDEADAIYERAASEENAI